MKKAGKVAWLAYAIIGSILYYSDGAARGEHILGTMIIFAYSLPSSLLLAAVAASFGAFDYLTPVTWLLMVTLNGWLLFRLFCLFEKRTTHVSKLKEPKGP